MRVEVQVPRDDAAAVRTLAGVLRGDDPALAARARRTLHDIARVATGRRSLKDLLASAPLEGVDLERSRDLGRGVDLT